MAQDKILLRPYNVWPEKGLTYFEGMFYCLQCRNSFMFLSWDGEMMWHDNPLTDPDRPVSERHTEFTAWTIRDGEQVPL